MANEEATKKTSLNMSLNIMPYIVAGAILIVMTIISYFPPLTFTVLNKETTVYLIPLAIQMMLRFFLLSFLFFVIVAFVLTVHVFLIVKLISLLKQFKQSIDDMIEYINNL